MASDRERLNQLRQLKQLRGRSQAQPAAGAAPQAPTAPIAAPEAPREDGFLERVGDVLKERVGESKEIRKGFETGESGIASTALQRLGLGFGTGVDIAGEAATSGLRALPGFIEEPLRSVGSAVGKGAGALAELAGEIPVIGTGETLGERVGKDVQFVSEEFEKLDPNVKRNIKAAGEIAPFVTPAGAVTRPVKAAAKVIGKVTPDIGKVGKTLEKTAEKQVARKKADFLEELILPRETLKTAEKQIAKGQVTEGGVLAGRKVAPSATEKSIINEVNKVPTVTKKNTMLQNNNAIRQEVDNKASQLVKDLEAKKIIFPKKELKADINKEIARIISEEPLVVGDAGKTAERLLKTLNKIIDENPSTPAGVLKMRKQFDLKVKETVGDLFKDESKVKAINIANDGIRKTINNFIERKVPDVGVKQSLKEQHLLLKAMDSIAPKAARESGTKIGRLMQNIEKSVPLLKGKLGKLTGLAIVGGGAIVPGAAPAVGAIGAGVLLTKGARSATVKRSLGKLLKFTDQAIKKTTDADLLKQLKADRIALITIIEQAKQKGDKK